MELQIKNDIESIFEQIVQLRRQIHAYPEIAREEYETQKLVINYLQMLNIECRKIAGTGVLAIINPEKKHRVLALRADLDALPMTELNDVAYKSTIVGKMHACGHDVHTAILLGAANILKRYQDQIDAKVILLFQPDEEDLGGAQRMIAEGAIDHVDMIFGLHVNNAYQTGEVAIRYGQMNASSDMYKIIVHGKAAHGAYPEQGSDAILAAAQIITASQSIVARNISPLNSAVITFGKIYGGEVRNSIASKVEIDGIVRTLNPETRTLVNQRLQDLLNYTAQAMGVSVEIQHTPSYPVLMNTDAAVAVVEKSAQAVVGSHNIKLKPNPSLGVEDFAYYCEKISGAFFNLGTGNIQKGFIYENHSQYFDIDEDAMKIGIEMQVMNILNASKI